MTAKPDADKVEAVAVELRLDRISRLYNSLDPAPFNEKELEVAADEYIVGSAEDLSGRPMRLVIMLPDSELSRPEAAHIPEAVRHHFVLRELTEQRRLRAMLQRGRMSLLIGLAFLAACLLAREVLTTSETTTTRILDEGLLIVGWVAMWGPLDIFLYGWWPIVGRRRLFADLSQLDVELRPLR
jgi:hypothetical protein